MNDPVYRTIGGVDYVLVSHAAKHMDGMASDTIGLVLAFVRAYRPEDKALHEAIASLQEKKGDLRGAHILDGVSA